MKPVALSDRVWLGLCVVSLLCHLLCSVAVRTFGREFGCELSQLIAKL